MEDDETVDPNIAPEPKKSFAEMDREANERLGEELKSGAYLQADDEPPAEPVEEPPVPAAPAAPAAPPPTPKEDPEPVPAAAAAPTDDLPTTDFTEIFEEFDGDPAKMAAALADARTKGAWKPSAPATAPAATPAAAPAPAAAAPAAAAAPEPTAPAKDFDPIEYLDAIIKKPDEQKTEEERALAHGVGRVGQMAQARDAAAKAVNDKAEELKSLHEQIAEESVIQKRAKAKVDKNPDDFRAAEELEASTGTLRELQRNREFARLELSNLENDATRAGQTWRTHRDRLANATTEIHTRDSSIATSRAASQQKTDAALEQWNREFPEFLKRLNLGEIDADTSKAAQKLLGGLAYADLAMRRDAGLGDFESLPAWMDTHANVVRGLVEAGRRSAVKTYVQQKKRDAQPRAPQGAAASGAAPESGRGSKKKMTWEQANNASADQAEREFGGRA